MVGEGQEVGGGGESGRNRSRNLYLCLAGRGGDGGGRGAESASARDLGGDPEGFAPWNALVWPLAAHRGTWF